MKPKTIGYMVVDIFSKPLHLSKGYLSDYDWQSKSRQATLFSTRASALRAIRNTDKHWEASKYCLVIRVTGETEGDQQ